VRTRGTKNQQEGEVRALRARVAELEEAIRIIKSPHAELLAKHYREPFWRDHDDTEGTHSLAKPFISIGNVLRFLDLTKGIEG
jgi:hypothetical protein